MSTTSSVHPDLSPISTRLSRLAALNHAELEALQLAANASKRFPARRELVAEGAPLREPRALLSGWACRQRITIDGRRQILSFLLPGDLIGVCRHSNPIASTSILSLTELILCPVPAADGAEGLAEAYARSGALEEHQFLAQITRLGRLDARERMADWFLETRERLMLAGLGGGDEFPLPLTQEMLADALGLTSVHVNRTLQGLRRDGLLALRGGMISLPDPQRLEELVDFRPARVSADDCATAASR